MTGGQDPSQRLRTIAGATRGTPQSYLQVWFVDAPLVGSGVLIVWLAFGRPFGLLVFACSLFIGCGAIESYRLDRRWNCHVVEEWAAARHETPGG